VQFGVQMGRQGITGGQLGGDDAGGGRGEALGFVQGDQLGQFGPPWPFLLIIASPTGAG
jgi:hypothetical protein